MHALQTIWRGLDWSVLTNLLLSVVPALLCITLHELAHGYVAYRLGDDTAKRAGRLTLNPLKHIDIMGLIMMVVLKFGWAKPVPVNMWKFKNPKKGMAITAAAGPLANLLIAFVFLFFYGLLFIPLTRLGNTGGYILEMIYITAYLSIALAIFNVIPIPPLDGSKVLYAFVSDRAYTKLMYYERYGMISAHAGRPAPEPHEPRPAGPRGVLAHGQALHRRRLGLCPREASASDRGRGMENPTFRLEGVVEGRDEARDFEGSPQPHPDAAAKKQDRGCETSASSEILDQFLAYLDDRERPGP